MSSVRKIAFVAVLLTAFLSAPTVSAQESAIIQATATVISSLTIVGSNSLIFASITPGINKTVARTTTGFAGEWTVSGTVNSELSLTFNLPSDLIHVASGIGMPIVFSSTGAAYSDGTGSQSVPTGIINPNGPSAERLGVGGQMVVWIGGTVQPSITQTGGDYASDVTLTIAYTGN